MVERKYCNINRHCPDWKVIRFRSQGCHNDYGCTRPIHDDCAAIEKRKNKERNHPLGVVGDRGAVGAHGGGPEDMENLT